MVDTDTDTWPGGESDTDSWSVREHDDPGGGDVKVGTLSLYFFSLDILMILFQVHTVYSFYVIHPW